MGGTLAEILSWEAGQAAWPHVTLLTRFHESLPSRTLSQGRHF